MVILGVEAPAQTGSCVWILVLLRLDEGVAAAKQIKAA